MRTVLALVGPHEQANWKSGLRSKSQFLVNRLTRPYLADYFRLADDAEPV